ncbi:MAG: hypothetical protein WAK91_05140 [Candidatus Acidiferrales bacterium]|jgi:hypothetical protein
MANKSKQVRWITISGGVLFIGILIWSSFRQTQVTYEVCTTFNNASHCATASGSNSEEAIHSAHDIDCSLLTNGRDELMRCSDSQPASVRQIQ